MIRSVFQEVQEVQTWKRRQSDQEQAREAIALVLEEQARRSKPWKATPRPGALVRLARLVYRRVRRLAKRETAAGALES